MTTGIATPEAELKQIENDDPTPLATGGPIASGGGVAAEWFAPMRADGWRDFESLAMPARTDEAWRFASVKSVDLQSFRRPTPVSAETGEELARRSRGLAESAGKMVFGNDQLIRRDFQMQELERKGVLFTSIEEAAVRHEAIFRKHFMTQEVALGSKKFAALHQAMVRSGCFLFIPRGVEVELPFEVFHWLGGSGGSTFPHTLVIAEEMSKVTLVDHFESSDPEAPGFACGMNDLYLGAGAELTYVNVQNWSARAVAIQINSTVVGRDARAVNMALNLGASYGRTESVSRLIGSGGRSDMLAVSVPDGTQEFDQRTLQDHREPDTASDLLYKNALYDKARTIFAGLIRVERGAHRTDAYQKVRNLLLSDDAEANSMPGLEILADDVRCTHGATSGQIEEEELFYLRSRGITPDMARQLIVFGFLNEVFDRLGKPAVQEKLRESVTGKLSRIGRK